MRWCMYRWIRWYKEWDKVYDVYVMMLLWFYMVIFMMKKKFLEHTFMFFSAGTHGFPMFSTILPPIMATIRLALNSSDDGWRKALCREPCEPPDEASCWSNQYRTSRASLSIWMAPPRLSLHLSSGKGGSFSNQSNLEKWTESWFSSAYTGLEYTPKLIPTRPSTSKRLKQIRIHVGI